jgi:hypothetical protein
MVFLIAACSPGYPVGSCGLLEEVSLTSAEDTLGGNFPFTSAVAVEAATGSWTGELSYNCDSGDSSMVSAGGAAFACGAEPAAELVTVTVDVPSISFPATAYLPENREDPSCESSVVFLGRVAVGVESELFMVSFTETELRVTGVVAPEVVDVFGASVTVPAESALSVYGTALDFQVASQDFILATDESSVIVASTGAGGMQKIQQ